jgi:hypothetical protein
MNLPEFEKKYRDSIDQILSDLQTVTLRLSELERKTLKIGESVQHVSYLVEEFLDSQKEDGQSQDQE